MCLQHHKSGQGRILSCVLKHLSLLLCCDRCPECTIAVLQQFSLSTVCMRLHWQGSVLDKPEHACLKSRCSAIDHRQEPFVPGLRCTKAGHITSACHKSSDQQLQLLSQSTIAASQLNTRQPGCALFTVPVPHGLAAALISGFKDDYTGVRLQLPFFGLQHDLNIGWSARDTGAPALQLLNGLLVLSTC